MWTGNSVKKLNIIADHFVQSLKQQRKFNLIYVPVAKMRSALGVKNLPKLHFINCEIQRIKKGENASKTNESMYGFFSEFSPLSTFHLAPFELDSIKFHTSEQYVQFKKVKLFHDEVVVH